MAVNLLSMDVIVLACAARACFAVWAQVGGRVWRPWCMVCGRLASPPARRGGYVAHVAQRARRARLWGLAVSSGAAGGCGSRAVRSPERAAHGAKVFPTLFAFARPPGAARPNSSRSSSQRTASGLLGRRMRTGRGYWRRAAQFCAAPAFCTREISAHRSAHKQPTNSSPTGTQYSRTDFWTPPPS